MGTRLEHTCWIWKPLSLPQRQLMYLMFVRKRVHRFLSLPPHRSKCKMTEYRWSLWHTIHTMPIYAILTIPCNWQLKKGGVPLVTYCMLPRTRNILMPRRTNLISHSTLAIVWLKWFWNLWIWKRIRWKSAMCVLKGCKLKPRSTYRLMYWRLTKALLLQSPLITMQQQDSTRLLFFLRRWRIAIRCLLYWTIERKSGYLPIWTLRCRSSTKVTATPLHST